MAYYRFCHAAEIEAEAFDDIRAVRRARHDARHGPHCRFGRARRMPITLAEHSFRHIAMPLPARAVLAREAASKRADAAQRHAGWPLAAGRAF